MRKELVRTTCNAIEQNGLNVMMQYFVTVLHVAALMAAASAETTLGTGRCDGHVEYRYVVGHTWTWECVRPFPTQTQKGAHILPNRNKRTEITNLYERVRALR